MNKDDSIKHLNDLFEEKGRPILVKKGRLAGYLPYES
jgi:hypothetical protein